MPSACAAVAIRWLSRYGRHDSTASKPRCRRGNTGVGFEVRPAHRKRQRLLRRPAVDAGHVEAVLVQQLRRQRSDFAETEHGDLLERHSLISSNLELDPLRERQRARIIHRARLPPHVRASTRREPDSRPPPVSFSPPNAPPISAPDGPMLTFAMPQSEPRADTNVSASRTSVVKMHDASPCGHVVVHARSRHRVRGSFIT